MTGAHADDERLFVKARGFENRVTGHGAVVFRPFRTLNYYEDLIHYFSIDTRKDSLGAAR
jgi:hypothetical protein